MAASNSDDVCVPPYRPPCKRQNTDDRETSAVYLVENGWEIIHNPRHIHQVCSTGPAILIYERAPRPLSFLTAFIRLIPIAIWDLLVHVVNRSLTITTSHNPRRRPVDTHELLQFYSIVISLENTFGNMNKSIKEHFSQVKESGFVVNGIGCDRFLLIKNSLLPTRDEIRQICRLLSSAACGTTRDVSVCAVDEAVISYTPSAAVKERETARGTKIPVVYVPRKPHPVGLEMYIAATYIEDSTTRHGLPWAIGIYPHLVDGDQGDAFRSLVHACPYRQVHWIADAWFTSESNMAAVVPPSTYTFTINSNYMPSLWKALQIGLPVNTWRAAARRDGVVVSCHTVTQHNCPSLTIQKIMSTGWRVTKSSVPVPVAAASSQEEEEQEEEEGGSQSSKIPCYTRENLASKKLVELTEICRRWEIRPSARKETVIEAILARVDAVHKEFSAVESAKYHLENTKHTGNAPLHDLYSTHFNWVDLINRRWGSVEEHHHHHRWEIKYTLMLLRVGVINAWTYHKSQVGLDWLDWRTALANDLKNNTLHQ